MLLPNRENAYIPEKKLKDYLLSETHVVGKTKAKYFRSLGYEQDNMNQLADDLLMIAKYEEILQEVTSPYGTKYIIEGEMPTPIESIARVRTVWVIEPLDKKPRFVTAYPA